MIFKVVLLLGLIFAVQGEYEPSQKARDCMVQAKIDEQTVRHLLTAQETFIEDDENLQHFFECCYGDHISSTNELIVDDKLTTQVANIAAVLLGDKREAASKVAREALEHCKDLKGDTKGKTLIRIVNCLKYEIYEFKETE